MANWWDHYPWRNVQTNLRERDMEDMDAKAYVARLKELGRVVYLHLPLEALERRLQNIHTRGIAMAPGETLADLFACRAPLYRRYADLTVDVGDQTLEETVAAVLQALDGSQGPSRLTL